MARVLIVEDSPFSAQVLVELLKTLDYESTGIASTADDAVRQAANADVVLMDIHLSGPVDGVEAARQIEPLGVPVVFITANDDVDQFLRARQANAAGYLVKPADRISLHNAIELALHRARLQTTIGELEKALDQVKRLQGLLPICCYCKRIRDDQNYWHEVERYIVSHSEAEFSHGICPTCLSARYPDFQD